MTVSHANLGRSGLKVSRVSLGSWLTIGNAVDQTGSNELVHRSAAVPQS